MAAPTQAQITAQIGNATRELSPEGACFRYYEPGDSYACLVWMDDPAIQPTEAATMVKAAELAEAALLFG
jgi:hypothetical protein